MPKSKPSARRRAATRRVGAPEPPPEKRRLQIRGNKWVSTPLIIVGAILFLASNIGARSGFVFLPFDPHHVYGQMGGGLILIAGLTLL